MRGTIIFNAAAAAAAKNEQETATGFPMPTIY